MLRSLVVLLAGLAASSVAWAQTQPFVAQPVPALGEAGLIGLVAAAAAVGGWALRKRGGSRRK